MSVVAELERNLELEQPRQNVDLRNTLQAPTPKDGKKKKVIAYEVSELRGVEVLEELCKGMDQYGIVRQEDGTVSFQRYNAKGAGTVRIMGSMTLGSDQFQEDRKRLQSYCDALVEEVRTYIKLLPLWLHCLTTSYLIACSTRRLCSRQLGPRVWRSSP